MSKPSPKDHYQELRRLSCERLWDDEVPAFDQAPPAERLARVAVVRAVGVVFSESGTPGQREQARQWLLPLLRDPAEKIRRYAMTALPKLGAGAGEEAALLATLARAASARETAHVARTLEKIGGEATVEIAAGAPSALLARAAQKAAANVARRLHASTVRLDRRVDAPGLRVILRCRSGLEPILEDELREQSSSAPKFRLAQSGRGILVLAPLGPFSLADVHALRCFSAASLGLGTVARRGDIDALAAVIAAPASRRLLADLTDGPLRYRLEFAAAGHQRGAVRRLGNLVHARCPDLLNDSRDAPWQIDIHDVPGGQSVELTPRLRPDPRFAYRRRDVPAASHPPLAAAMARLAGRAEDERVWDPFCGSGLELVERARRGGVRHLLGTDLSAEAVEITRENLTAAGFADLPATLTAADFRAVEPGRVSLVITNPPLGRRVPIPDLRGLILDLFAAAAAALRPGGRLVLANPLSIQPAARDFALEFRARVDLGGFHCHLEKYVRR